MLTGTPTFLDFLNKNLTMFATVCLDCEFTPAPAVGVIIIRHGRP
jgi:hypothetical protein